MTAAYGTITNVAFASRTNTTVNVPASTANGNHLLLAIVTANSGTAVTPSALAGWTRIGTDQTGTDGSFGWRLQVYQRTAASEPASYTVTHATTNSCVLMIRTTGSGTLSTDGTSQNSGNGSPLTATAVSPVTTDALLYFIGLNWDLIANLPPAGMTERQDGQFIYLASEALTASGSTGTRTQVQGPVPWFANLYAIKDVAGGGTHYTMPATTGTLTAAGQANRLARSRDMDAVNGTLTLAGQANRLSRSRKAASEKGQLTLAGPVVNLIYSGAGAKVLPAGLGFPVLSGHTAVLRYIRKMPAAVSMATLGGQSAGLIYTEAEGDRVMPASAGVLRMAGQSAFLDVTRIPPKTMKLQFGRKVYLRRW